MNHYRDRRDCGLTGAQIELGSRFGVAVDAAPEHEVHEAMMPHKATGLDKRALYANDWLAEWRRLDRSQRWGVDEKWRTVPVCADLGRALGRLM
jgi:hypothetical protein